MNISYPLSPETIQRILPSMSMQPSELSSMFKRKMRPPPLPPIHGDAHISSPYNVVHETSLTLQYHAKKKSGGVRESRGRRMSPPPRCPPSRMHVPPPLPSLPMRTNASLPSPTSDTHRKCTTTIPSPCLNVPATAGIRTSKIPKFHSLHARSRSEPPIASKVIKSGKKDSFMLTPRNVSRERHVDQHRSTHELHTSYRFPTTPATSTPPTPSTSTSTYFSPRRYPLADEEMYLSTPPLMHSPQSSIAMAPFPPCTPAMDTQEEEDIYGDILDAYTTISDNASTSDYTCSEDEDHASLFPRVRERESSVQWIHDPPPLASLHDVMKAGCWDRSTRDDSLRDVYTPTYPVLPKDEDVSLTHSSVSSFNEIERSKAMEMVEIPSPGLRKSMKPLAMVPFNMTLPEQKKSVEGAHGLTRSVSARNPFKDEIRMVAARMRASRRLSR